MTLNSEPFALWSLLGPLQIRESAYFNEYITNAKRGLSDKSKAEAIAAQTKRTIKENYHREKTMQAYLYYRILRKKTRILDTFTPILYNKGRIVLDTWEILILQATLSKRGGFYGGKFVRFQS